MTSDDLRLSESNAAALFLHSSLREKVLEHLFVGELLKVLWQRGRRDIEVLRTEVDASGFDLILECNGVMRHIQLKSSHRSAQTRSVDIGTKLAAKPSGCVIWIEFDANTLELGPYWWLGEIPGHPLSLDGYPVSRHTRRGAGGIKAERTGLRAVRKTQFRKIESLPDLIDRLFLAHAPARVDQSR